MRVIVTEFQGDARSEVRLQQGKDYLESEAEVDEGETILLLRRLRPSRSRILLQGETCTAEFHLEPNREISVEIMNITDGFWSISEVSESEAESIIRMASRGEAFGQLIPGTNREWDAWGPAT